MLGVCHVRAGLIPDANDVQGDQHGVHQDGENGMEDMSDEHDALHQEQEEREDGNDDVELGGAARGGCQRTTSLFRHGWTGTEGPYDAAQGNG